MTRKARLWIGTTLLIIVAFNYLVMAIPLYNRMNSLENKIKVLMIKQVKSGEVLKNTEDGYIIEVLQRATIDISKKLVIINCVAVSVAVFILSWLLFGMFLHREDRRKI